MKKLFTIIAVALMTICASAATTTENYIVNAVVEATHNGVKKTVTYEKQTLTTYDNDGDFSVTVPEASFVSGSATFTLLQTTIGGLVKDADGNVSLADNAAPVIQYTKTTNMSGETGMALCDATITDVTGNLSGDDAKITVKATSDLGDIKVVYTPYVGPAPIEGGKHVLTAVVEGYKESTATRYNETFENVEVYVADNGDGTYKVTVPALESEKYGCSMEQTVIDGVNPDKMFEVIKGAEVVVSKDGKSLTVKDITISEFENTTTGMTLEIEGNAYLGAKYIGYMSVIYTEDKTPVVVKTVEATYQDYVYAGTTYANYKDPDWGMIDGAKFNVDFYENDSLVIRNWMNQDLDLCIKYDATTGDVLTVNNPGSAPSTQWTYASSAYWCYISTQSMYNKSFVDLTNKHIYLMISFGSTWENYNISWDSNPTAVNAVSAASKVTSAVIKTPNYIMKNGVKYNYAGQQIK